MIDFNMLNLNKDCLNRAKAVDVVKVISERFKKRKESEMKNIFKLKKLRKSDKQTHHHHNRFKTKKQNDAKKEGDMEDDHHHERPKTVTDLVYNLNRYQHDHSPMIIYIPSKAILFKMMRACVGCKTK